MFQSTFKGRNNHQTFEFSEVCKCFKFGITLEFISVAAAICITWRTRKPHYLTQDSKNHLVGQKKWNKDVGRN